MSETLTKDRPIISVEMIPGDHVLLRFGYAFATRRAGKKLERLERLEGQINLSLQNLEEAETLRDALSALITFQRRMPSKKGVEA